MAEPQRHIDHLHVRVPGADADAGARLSTDLTRALEQLPPATRSAAHANLHLRVHVAAGASEAAIARAIADAIANL